MLKTQELSPILPHCKRCYVYEEIEENYERNLKRVRNLYSLYDSSKSKGRGRKSVQDTDVLRASVVLLHATVENLLRKLIGSKLPKADEAALNSIPLAGGDRGGRAEKFFLGALVRHKGKSIENLLEESVSNYLEQISFNDTTEIISRMKTIGIAYSDDGMNVLSSIDAMIRRRHNIVHQADSNKEIRSGSYHALALNKKTVNIWIESTDRFVKKILQLAKDIGDAY